MSLFKVSPRFTKDRFTNPIEESIEYSKCSSGGGEHNAYGCTRVHSDAADGIPTFECKRVCASDKDVISARNTSLQKSYEWLKRISTGVGDSGGYKCGSFELSIELISLQKTKDIRGVYEITILEEIVCMRFQISGIEFYMFEFPTFVAVEVESFFHLTPPSLTSKTDVLPIADWLYIPEWFASALVWSDKAKTHYFVELLDIHKFSVNIPEFSIGELKFRSSIWTRLQRGYGFYGKRGYRSKSYSKHSSDLTDSKDIRSLTFYDLRHKLETLNKSLCELTPFYINDKSEYFDAIPKSITIGDLVDAIHSRSSSQISDILQDAFPDMQNLFGDYSMVSPAQRIISHLETIIRILLEITNSAIKYVPSEHYMHGALYFQVSISNSSEERSGICDEETFHKEIPKKLHDLSGRNFIV